MALAFALAACSGGADGPESDGAGTTQPPGAITDTQSPAGSADGPFTRYVALGDSYTAAPLTPGTDLAGGCLRSDRNYPALLAESLGVRLVDVSCSGADTSDVTEAQTFQVPTGETVRIPPQRRALNGRTDLVTIGLGGNDEGLFGRIAGACTQGSPEDCAAALEDDLGGDLDTITGNLEDVVGEVRDRVADDAVVVLVGYPRLAPQSGTCPELPVTEADLSRLDEAVRGLNSAVRDAARESDAVYLDLYRPSRGHDICADEPWINGIQTVQGEALALHPFAVEQQAVARLLEPVVREAAR